MRSLILFICLFFSPFAICQAVPASRILVLNSYHKGFPWTDNIVNGVESVLDREKIGVDLVIEYMDSKSIKYDITYKTMLYELYAYKYRPQKFDVVISSDDNAFNFLREYYQAIFPDTPIIFCGVNNLGAPNLISREHFTGILEISAEKETLDLAFKLHPETKQVVVVTDNTPSGKYRWGQLEPHFVQYPQITFTRIDDSFSITEIEDKMKDLSDDAIAVFTTLYRDKTGRYISLAEGASRISKSSKRPIYTFHTQVLKHGTIGGKLLGGRHHGEKSAEMAIRILKGEKVSNIPIIDRSVAEYRFDYQQLKRFGIKSSSLPKESILVNTPFSFYEEYKGVVWTTIF
ncbi:MAG: ABC transporter substrate binding protein, partial [Desulfobacteraceae bacterium]